MTTKSLTLMRPGSLGALFLASILACIALPSAARGQWTQTPGPSRCGVRAFSSGSALYAGTNGQGVYRSTDAGDSWAAANSGIETATIVSLTEMHGLLLAGTEIASAPSPAYRSTNGGGSWQAAGSGLPSLTVNVLLEWNGSLFAGTGGQGVYKSTDAGTTWFASNNGMGAESVSGIVRNGTKLFASGYNFLYVSTDAGASWNFTNGGQYFPIAGMYSIGSVIYCGGFQGLIRSTDGGASFGSRIDVPFIGPVHRLTSFWSDGTAVYAGVSSSPGSGGSGVIRSTDQGLTWTPSNGGIEIVDVQALAAAGSRLLAGSIDKTVLVSDDAGATWSSSNTGMPPGGSVRGVLAAGSNFFAGTEGDGVYRSADAGLSWTHASSEASGFLQNETVLALAERGGRLFAGTTAHGVFRSTDAGSSWSAVNTGLPSGDFGTLDLGFYGDVLLAGTSEGLFRSTDFGDHWSLGSLPQATINAIAATETYACLNLVTGFSTSDGIYRSTDGGLNWAQVLNSPITSYIADMSALGTYVYAGIFYGGGLLRSSNTGLSWADVSPAQDVYSVLPIDLEVFAGTDASTGQAYRSTDRGDHWLAFNEGFPPGEAGEALAVNAAWVLVGTDRRGVWRRERPGAADVAEGNEGHTGPDPVGPGREGLVLRWAGPNPAREEAEFVLDLPRPSSVTATIHAVTGRLVRTLLTAGSLSFGLRTLRWDGRDGSGAPAPAGIYFCRVEASGLKEARVRFVLTR